MRVLLLVDVQKDFCKNGALAVPDGDQVVQVINELMQNGGYDLIIATKDWHPANHMSFAANHPGKEVFQVVDLHGLPQTLWPVHCVENSLGSQFHGELKANLIDKIIYKGMDPEIDSYSGFFDNGRRKETELRSYLEKYATEQGIKKEDIQLSVCGLATDYCVGFTARDAVSIGYRTEILVDACRAVNLSPGDDIKMLNELAASGVKISDSRAALAMDKLPLKRDLNRLPNLEVRP